MTCDDFRAAFLAGELHEAHFAHLSGCEACRVEQARLADAVGVLGDADLWHEPAPDLADRVEEAVAGRAARPVRRRVVGWMAAVAAVAVLAATAGLGWRALAGGPDWEVALFPTERAPQASATVQGWNTESGTRLAIDATGLAPAPAGFVYELWFSAEDVHVSAGTFTAFDDVTAWVGVRRGDYPRLWITLEAVDDHPGPSPTTVLDTGR